MTAHQHQLQRIAERRAGVARLAGIAPQTLAVNDDAQDRPHRLRAGFFDDCYSSNRRPGGLASLPGHTSFEIARCSPGGLSNTRRIGGGSLPAIRSGATNFCGAHRGSRTRLNYPLHHVACKLTDAAECHILERLSCAVAVEATQPREASHCAGKPPQGRGNV